MNPIRVLVAEDTEVYRSGVVAILGCAPDIEVVGEAADGAEALALASRTRMQVALIDLRMPVLGGVETIRRLAIDQPACRCIVLTNFDEDGLIFDALRAGAAGYLLKDLTAESILRAVRQVARGESVLAPSVTSRVLAEFVRLPPSRPALRTPSLSPREREVLRLIAAGRRTRRSRRRCTSPRAP